MIQCRCTLESHDVTALTQIIDVLVLDLHAVEQLVHLFLQPADLDARRLQLLFGEVRRHRRAR